GLFKVVDMDMQLRQLVMSGANEAELDSYVTSRGIKDMRQQGVQRIIDGITTVEEVLRVTGEDS
ncbi:MAG TPA: type II secretion system protein GspE, partial [bacterium]|nr:type II secretion system protein GspE [bacterium]